MIIKVDSDELKMVIEKMRSDSENFNKEIDNMISLINNNLASTWQGADSDSFQKNVVAYLEKMKSIPTSLTNLSNIIEKINKGYEDDDESFGKILEGVSNEYAE